MSIDLDQKVFEFLEKERSEGRVGTNDMLRTKAVQIAGGLSIQGSKEAMVGCGDGRNAMMWE